MGCGVSAVASITGLPYEKALRLFAEPDRHTTHGFRRKHLLQALERAGLKYVRRRVDAIALDDICDGSVVFVRLSERDSIGHCLVRDDDQWLDSLDRPYKLQAKGGKPSCEWLPPKIGRRWSWMPREYHPHGQYLMPE